MNDESLKDASFTDDRSMVLVEYPMPGREKAQHWVGVDEALLGEAHGRWRVVRKPQQQEKMLVPSLGAAARPDALTSGGLFAGTYETKGVKKKRIVWIQDLLRRGGAEISNELVVKTGIECGFAIRVVTQTTDLPLMERLLSQCDLVVLNNIWAFSKRQMEAIQTAIYSEGVPYIKYEHDHRELSRPEFSARLFANSRLNVFLSPAHRQNYLRGIGADGICLPLAIDVDLFTPTKGVKREKNSACVNKKWNMQTWNALHAYIRRNLDITFTVISEDGLSMQGLNIRHQDPVPHEKLPAIFSAHEYVVHLLDGWGAGERMIFEAALCGCRIVANDKVGHMSWNRNLRDLDGLRIWLRQAPFEFWKAADRILT